MLWRSLEELDGEEEFLRWVRQEFPEGLERAFSEPSRRQLLGLMAASFALGGGAACSYQPAPDVVAYSRAPDQALQRGRSVFFASAVLHEGWASPVVVETSMGRPIKVEGNPEHPESRGATDVFAQASVLGMYDPGRARGVLRHGQPATWPSSPCCSPSSSPTR